MTEAELLHLIFSVSFLVFLFERGYFQSRAMRRSGELAKYKANRLAMLFLLLILLIGQLWVLGSFVYIIYPRFLEWFAVPLWSWIRWMAIVPTVLGIGIELSTQVYLGRNYSTLLNISEEQTLVTTGPYRYVRHPMYTALVTVGIGLTLLSANLYFGLPFIALIVVVVFRIRKEEEVMNETFGEEYIEYKKRTKRFIPYII